MSLLDVLIPGIIGLGLFAWPQVMFLGSKATPTDKRLRLIRMIGGVLLAVAVLYLGIKVVSRS